MSDEDEDAAEECEKGAGEMCSDWCESRGTSSSNRLGGRGSE